MIFAGSDGVQLLQKPVVGGGIRGMKAWTASPCGVFIIDAAHIGAVEMNPPKLPQIVGCPMRVGFFAVQEHAVSGF